MVTSTRTITFTGGYKHLPDQGPAIQRTPVIDTLSICPMSQSLNASLPALNTKPISVMKRRFLRVHAPSLPNSAVHSALLLMSASLTVGLAPFTALTKSFRTSGGSSNLSDSTSVQDISIAPLSPGEQGVSFSSPSTVT